MYSLVLMAAVASSGDAASFHKRSIGCNGCSGAPIVYTVGCYGSATPIGCTGCRGCTGCSGFTAHSTSCYGCGGGCFGSGWSCTGCCGGIVGWHAPASVAPLQIMGEPVAPVAEPKSAPANIEIELPADANLIVDGKSVPGQGALRSFSTPELPAGKNYYYDMTAEINLNGTSVRQELRIVVRGGETMKHSFGELLAKAKAAKPTDVVKK